MPRAKHTSRALKFFCRRELTILAVAIEHLVVEDDIEERAVHVDAE